MAYAVSRVPLGRIHVTPLTFDAALERLVALKQTAEAQIIVTPNIAHVWQAEKESALIEVYERSALAPPDGWPVVSSLRHLLARGTPVERVTGADLLPALAESGGRIALVGGQPGASEKAARNLTAKFARVEIGLVEAVPPGELDDPARRRALVGRVRDADCDYIFLGLGVPKQEKLALDLADALPRGVILCVGAAIDFAGGVVNRAPERVALLKLEWAYRLAREPRRLFSRYALSAPYFVKVVLREYLRMRSGTGSSVR